MKRVMRIYPALIVCCFLSAFVFSWTFGGASFTQIIGSESAWRYFASNSVAVWNEHFVSGVYETHPQHGLNGSLWSVTLEVRMYLFLALLYLAGFIRGRVGCFLVFSGVIVALGIDPNLVPLIGNDHQSFGNYDFPVFACVFLLGGGFFLLEKEFTIDFGSVIVFALAVILLKGSGFYRGAIFSFIVVLAIWFATRKSIVAKLNLESDYSYGVYLYGWPAQQIAYQSLQGMTSPQPWLVTLVAVPVSLGLALLSWHFVERPCIRFAHGRFGGETDVVENKTHAASTTIWRSNAD